MRDEILLHLNDARQLEKLYRANRQEFRKSFTVLYPELRGNVVAEFWNERLNFETEEINWGRAAEFIFVVIAALVAGMIARIPDIFPIEEEVFYSRNAGFIIFPALMAYFAWKRKLSLQGIAFLLGALLVALVFINSFPGKGASDTLVLSCIHLILFLWALLGFSYVGHFSNATEARLKFLKYNGDLVVITTLILLAGAILSGITIGLFSLIGFDITNFYFENIVITLLPAAPILGTYLTQNNPQLVGKVSPALARIFSPLVLLMLVIYLGAMAYAGRDPYTDREFLMIFNLLLLGVMAIILFSVAGGSSIVRSGKETWILLLLAAVTLVVNGIAVSAILFRISEWGITPNRAAVLGGNVLILLNLLLVSIKLLRVVSGKSDIEEVGGVIARYLPVYFAWTIIVTFLFPWIF